jgi:hypothetical protein
MSPEDAPVNSNINRDGTYHFVSDVIGGLYFGAGLGVPERSVRLSPVPSHLSRR